jgi:hypothetical protein
VKNKIGYPPLHPIQVGNYDEIKGKEEIKNEISSKG